MKRFIAAASRMAGSLALVLIVPWSVSGQVEHQHHEADRQHDEAMAVLTTAHFKADLQVAAARHQEVALARAETDPRRTECLRTQAQLLALTGDREGARWFLESAGLHAQATGDLFGAAMAYIDAALVAADGRDFARATLLGERVKSIIAHEGLSSVERDVLLIRVRSRDL